MGGPRPVPSKVNSYIEWAKKGRIFFELSVVKREKRFGPLFFGEKGTFECFVPKGFIADKFPVFSNR
jgi:hypothetical protein